MSTIALDGLTQLLENLSVSTTLSDLSYNNILVNPLDILRALLAELLISLADGKVEDAYKSIQWPNDIFNGDLSVTLPRLRPGCKPNELSSEIVDKV
jgi:arginyl-tRNA synthetase